jgi:hypothetical protein
MVPFRQEDDVRKRSFDDDTICWVRELPLSVVLDKLGDAGLLFWRRDLEFVPEKDKRTIRVFVCTPAGSSWELLFTGSKWYDTRARKGAGGGIDLAMHLLRVDFVQAVKLLARGAPAISKA